MGLSDMTAGILDGPTGFEPQRMNNGQIFVTIPGMNDQVLQLAIQTFDLPKESQNPIQVAHLNEKRKFAGGVEYGDINCSFNDYIDINVAGFIQDWRRMVYNPVTGKIGWKRNYAGAGHISLYGPNGQYERTYDLIGVWPSSYDPGQVDQSNEEIMRVSLVLTIDKAVPSTITPSTDYGTD